ncbi:MAG: DUF4007 family protein [Pyrinomonadaceae bacterium]
MSKLKANNHFSFSGHETFPFRHGWLKKGVDAVMGDPGFFGNDRAMIGLGVGKNMVQSIRHWCLIGGLIQEGEGPTSRGQLFPTEIGTRLFSNGGFDPYLEDPGSLWLLHWLIACNLRAATTWYWMFSYWNGIEFTKDHINYEIQSWVEKHGSNPISSNSLKRDLDCFVRTYVQSRQTKPGHIEDTLDCPLIDLRLITELSDGKTYQFQRGPQVSLPNEIFAFAFTEFWRLSASDARSIAFEKIAYDPGSPGRIFKLDEDSIAARLEGIGELTGGAFTYDETAGLKQVYKHREPKPMSLLAAFYNSQKGKKAA